MQRRRCWGSFGGFHRGVNDGHPVSAIEAREGERRGEAGIGIGVLEARGIQGLGVLFGEVGQCGGGGRADVTVGVAEQAEERLDRGGLPDEAERGGGIPAHLPCLVPETFDQVGHGLHAAEFAEGDDGGPADLGIAVGRRLAERLEGRRVAEVGERPGGRGADDGAAVGQGLDEDRILLGEPFLEEEVGLLGRLRVIGHEEDADALAVEILDVGVRLDGVVEDLGRLLEFVVLGERAGLVEGVIVRGLGAAPEGRGERDGQRGDGGGAGVEDGHVSNMLGDRGGCKVQFLARKFRCSRSSDRDVGQRTGPSAPDGLHFPRRWCGRSGGLTWGWVAAIAVRMDRVAELAVNTIRTLAVDAVEQARSGHPGLPMGCADFAFVLWTKFLKFNPANPGWADRDRFVLSAGHGSMLLYSLFHLAGFKQMTLEQVRSFRQWGSATPGHPEFGMTDGVECTTGPLGQGTGNSVGMAIAQKFKAARFNEDGFPVCDHRVYAIVSDGDLEEGVSHEAAALAGHLGLDNLTWFFDDNSVSIEGMIDLACSDDVPGRFAAYGWHVIRIDGHDHAQIEAALREAVAHKGAPT